MEKIILQDVILITGGTKGIGFSIASALAQAQQTVVVVGRCFEDADKYWNKENFTNIYKIVADLQNSEESVEHIIRWLRQHNFILKALINNAAHLDSNGRKLVTETPLEEWDTTFAVNVRTPFMFCQKLIPFLQGTNGRVIINISTHISQIPAPGRVCYAASKAALDAVTRGLASELENSNITVVGLHPGGSVLTPGVMKRRPPNFDYTGFLSSDILNEPVKHLISEETKKYNGKILSALDFPNKWN